MRLHQPQQRVRNTVRRPALTLWRAPLPQVPTAGTLMHAGTVLTGPGACAAQSSDPTPGRHQLHTPRAALRRENRTRFPSRSIRTITCRTGCSTVSAFTASRPKSGAAAPQRSSDSATSNDRRSDRQTCAAATRAAWAAVTAPAAPTLGWNPSASCSTADQNYQPEHCL